MTATERGDGKESVCLCERRRYQHPHSRYGPMQQMAK